MKYNTYTKNSGTIFYAEEHNNLRRDFFHEEDACEVNKITKTESPFNSGTLLNMYQDTEGNARFYTEIRWDDPIITWDSPTKWDVLFSSGTHIGEIQDLGQEITGYIGKLYSGTWGNSGSHGTWSGTLYGNWASTTEARWKPASGTITTWSDWHDLSDNTVFSHPQTFRYYQQKENWYLDGGYDENNYIINYRSQIWGKKTSENYYKLYIPQTGRNITYQNKYLNPPTIGVFKLGTPTTIDISNETNEGCRIDMSVSGSVNVFIETRKFLD